MLRIPKATKPKGSVVRLVWSDLDTALLLREHGTERKAGWWVLAPGDDVWPAGQVVQLTAPAAEYV